MHLHPSKETQYIKQHLPKDTTSHLRAQIQKIQKCSVTNIRTPRTATEVMHTIKLHLLSQGIPALPAYLEYQCLEHELTCDFQCHKRNVCSNLHDHGAVTLSSGKASLHCVNLKFCSPDSLPLQRKRGKSDSKQN